MPPPELDSGGGFLFGRCHHAARLLYLERLHFRVNMKHHRISILLAWLLFWTSGRLLAAGDWPEFRGPTGQGLSDATGVPVEWNATKNVAWKTEIPGQGWSSPVLSAGRLYLTTAVGGNGDPVTLHALCLDADHGKILWDTEIFQPDPVAVAAMHHKNSTASPTPIVTADKLYVHFGHMGTAALDLSGKILWRENVLKYSPVHGNGGSPILLGDELIFNCDGASDPFMAALDAATGHVKWRTPQNALVRNKFSFCTPLAIEVDGATQVISPASGFVGGYDPTNGHELWRVRYGDGYSVVPRPVFAHGLIYISSGFDSPVVYAINPAGAHGDVTDTHVAWKHRKGGPTTPSLLVVGDNLYCVSDLGIASCVDAVTGNLHWTHRFDGKFSASPVAAEGRVYFQNEDGVGFVIKAGTSFEQLAENDLGERSLASYAVTDHALFIRTEKHLWKIAAGG